MNNLWIALKEDKEPALLEIYKYYYADLLNYGLRISGNEDVTRDCIQDLFVQLWSRDSYADIIKPKPYLLRSLRNIILDAMRYGKQVDSKTGDNLPEMVLSQEDIIINDEISSETGIKIKAAMAALTNRQKEVVFLRFYSGLNYEEIAEVTAISNQSVRNLFSTALRELRKQMIPALLIASALNF